MTHITKDFLKKMKKNYVNSLENKELIIIIQKNDLPLVTLQIEKKNETDAKEIANHFNGYFTSVAGKLNRKIAKTKNTYLSYLVSMKEDMFPMLITPDDMEVLMGHI